VTRIIDVCFPLREGDEGRIIFVFILFKAEEEDEKWACSERHLLLKGRRENCMALTVARQCPFVLPVKIDWWQG